MRELGTRPNGNDPRRGSHTPDAELEVSGVEAHNWSDMKFTRITVRPDVCTGRPCIRDLRAYPDLQAADIDEALRYAASLAEDETIELVG